MERKVMGFFLLLLGGVLGAIVSWLYHDSRRPGASDRRDATSPDEAEMARLRQQVSEHSAARQSLEAEIQSLKRVREENESLKGKLAMAAHNGPSKSEELPQLTTPSTASPDDLTAIKGVGPVLSAKLNTLGYTTYRQIAELDSEHKARIEEVLHFKGRIDRENWVEQARELASQHQA